MGNSPEIRPVGAAIPETASSLDMLLDDLFPNPEVTPQAATTQPTAAPQPQPPAQPQATTPEPTTQTTTPPDSFFLKTPTGTVYKTKEEAERGYAEKDRVIEKLRQDYIRDHGVDPITGKPASISVVTQQQPQQPQSYAQSDQFFDDLYKAVERSDKAAYRNTLGKFVAEIAGSVTQQVLAPLQPLVSEFSRNSATSRVAQEISNFANFTQTPEYKAVLDEFPSLKQAITAAEENPGYAAQLPEYYKMAYRAAYGKAVPEMVRTATTQTQTPQAQPAIRPTSQGSSHPVSAQGPNAPTEQNIATSDGRKAIMAAFEAKYGRDAKI